MLAAVVLAFVPRLPSAQTAGGLAGGEVRMTPGTNRRLRAFAVTQIALSFVLLTGAGMLLSALLALQTAQTGVDTRKVLAVDVPMPLETGAKALDFYREAIRRIDQLPGVEQVAVGNFVPWRDVTPLLPTFPITAEGYAPADGEENPRAHLRIVSPGFFGVLGIPILAGRDFTAEDRRGQEAVAIVSQSVAQRLFPNGQATDRLLTWTDPLFEKLAQRRIVGVVADLDDENVLPRPTLTVYHALAQVPYGGRLFVQAAGDPYALAAPVARVIRELSPDQPVERAATLADVRREVLAPERLNAFVLSGFAGVALLIAVVGVAGVLAFSVSARRREFGVRLAIGLAPRRLLAHVLSQGARIAAIGIGAGAAVGYGLARVAAAQFETVPFPEGLAALGAGAVLMTAALAASLLPAARAARVDVVQALRSE
jgi:predicted permease